VWHDVAQGRVLGPLFFVAYISPIAKIAGKLNVHQYADDTQPYVARSKKLITDAVKANLQISLAAAHM
jgi:hypothetical protein